MKNYDKSKQSSYPNYQDVIILYGWVIPQKLSVNDFKWVEETSQFHEDFIKIYDDDRDKGHFIEADILFT